MYLTLITLLLSCRRQARLRVVSYLLYALLMYLFKLSGYHFAIMIMYSLRHFKDLVNNQISSTCLAIIVNFNNI